MTKKRIIVAGVVLIVVALILILWALSGKRSSAAESTTSEYKVTTNSMTRTLTAAGQVALADTDTIHFSTSKTFRAMCVEENEQVEKGQDLILYSDGSTKTAPADGVVVSINAPETGSVGDSENFIEFGRSGTLSLEVTVPEDQISEISKGDKATISIGSDSSKTFYGKITEKREMSTTLISEKASEVSSSTSQSSSGTGAGSGTTGGSSSGSSGSADSSGSASADPFGSESSTAYYTVVLEFKNDGSVRKGMSASCTITLSDRSNVLTVPVEAVYFDKNDKAYVKLVDGSSTQKQTVTIGDSDANNVEIKKGLSKGDVIQVETQKQEEA